MPAVRSVSVGFWIGTGSRAESEAGFGGHPLGRAIIGRASVIAETPAEQIAGFHAGHYRPENIVIAAAGAVDHGKFVDLAARALAERTSPPAPPALPAPPIGAP